MRSAVLIKAAPAERRQLRNHLSALRGGAVAARLELACDRLGVGGRKGLARTLMRLEVEMSRLEQLLERPAMPAGPSPEPTIGAAARY